MSNPQLSFYDHHRQDYHHHIWRNDERAGQVGEFMVGDYGAEGLGGVGPLGELSVALYQFYPDEALSVQVRFFDDAHGTLHELNRLGVLGAIENADLHSRDALSVLLLAHGLRDASHQPLTPRTAA